MSAEADLAFVALFAILMPILDYLVLWPAFLRRAQRDPVAARRRLWIEAMVVSWALVAVGAFLWSRHDRSWREFGFVWPEGWRLWTACVVIAPIAAYYAWSAMAVAANADLRSAVRVQYGSLAQMMPHTRAELRWYIVTSLSSGFCEEFLFRAYFVWALAPWLGWWSAAALSIPAFAVA
ncbi:MAG: hypothetical protein SV422_14280, partial [Pseudomonadota bacterium]|nr:hypothetical protein [Pseudomonadota bacterium]